MIAAITQPSQRSNASTRDREPYAEDDRAERADGDEHRPDLRDAHQRRDPARAVRAPERDDHDPEDHLAPTSAKAERTCSERIQSSRPTARGGYKVSGRRQVATAGGLRRGRSAPGAAGRPRARDAPSPSRRAPGRGPSQRAVTAGSRSWTVPAAPSRSTSITTASNVFPTLPSRIAASSVETIPASYWPALRSDELHQLGQRRQRRTRPTPAPSFPPRARCTSRRRSGRRAGGAARSCARTWMRARRARRARERCRSKAV